MRRFYRPFLLIQLAAALLVVAYTVSPGVRAICLAVGAFKDRAGLPFAAASAALAGGLLPEAAKWLARRGAGAGAGVPGRRGDIAFNIAFFAFNGVVIDLLYRGEARLFGGHADVATVAAKVAFDQFVFNPVWLPIVIGLYLWRRNGFSAAATLRAVRARGFYRARVLPLLLPNWCFWLPMVSIIYALPVPLQFLLFVLALAAWSLIMVFIANQEDGQDAPG